ncbi:MAG: hypothetical protein JNL80_05815 [Phycisphaerae bacterium]|nr:hypothetical protein [Phycisphaerae bacterium]
MSLARLVNLRSMRRTAAAITLALAYWAFSPQAPAQFGGRGSFEDAFTPDFLARDVTLFVDALGLEEWQRPIIESLVMDYQTSFDAGVNEVKEEMSKVKERMGSTPPNPDTVMQLILQPIEKWSGAKKQLREQFIENVKTQLSEPQMERWPKFERAIRREKVLATGDIQGESVNLISVIRSLEFSPSVLAGLDPAIEEYEIRLDEALSSRTAKIESQKQRLTDAMTSSNHEDGVQAQEAIMAARVSVRDTQDNSRETLKNAVLQLTDEAKATEFELAALEKAYPKVYRNDPIMPLFASAKATEGITPEQTAALTELEGKYNVEILDTNNRLRDAYRSEEPKEPRRRVELMLARQQGGEAARTLRGEAELIQNARKSREEVYERYRKAIMDILNEEQQKQMPNFGKGDRIVPEQAERIREAKESARRTREPVNSPVSPNRPAENRDERKEKAQSEMRGRLRNSPNEPRREGQPEPRGGSRPGSNSVD